MNNPLINTFQKIIPLKPYLISKVIDFIDAPVVLVYSVVTDNYNFQWRKEVENIELLGNGFVEYYKGGGHTLFTNIMPFLCNTSYSQENGKESLSPTTGAQKSLFKKKYISKTYF